jgi:hypothetical protein
MKGYGGLSRQDLFCRFDQPALRPLPPERFVCIVWSAYLTTHFGK